MPNQCSIIILLFVHFFYNIRHVQCGCDVVNALGVSPTVDLTTGQVQGLSCLSAMDLPYFSFRGIPYAAPPLGDLRFRAPQPPKSWKGVLQAHREAPACSQPSRLINYPITYSEDCLFINVFTPYIKHPSGKLMPVIVWIHGGKFYQGSGSSYKYGPDFLLEKEVVVVTFNYRLGVFGFLSMNVSEAQGNCAMKDKVAALRWVKQEITKFGGDPNSVTIFGGSSSAGAVSLLYVSPTARGLFTRAISHSGSFLCRRSFRESTSDLGLQLAHALGCNSSTPHGLVACMRAVDSVELAEKQMIIKGMHGLENPFLPTVEVDLGEEVFLPSQPLDLIAQAPPVPYILGVTNGEGLMYVENPKKNPNQFKNLEETLMKYLPNEFLESSSPPVVQEVLSQVEDFYFSNRSSLENTIHGFVDFITDKNFDYCVLKTAKLISERAPVYLFYFTFEGDFQAKDHGYFNYNFTMSGVCHGEELGYFFYRNYTLPSQNNLSAHPRDMNMVERVTSIWTAFATFGNPTPFQSNDSASVWLPVKGNFTRYLAVGDVISMNRSPLLEKRFSFWDDLYNFINSSLELLPWVQSGLISAGTVVLLLCTVVFGTIFVSNCIRHKGYVKWG